MLIDDQVTPKVTRVNRPAGTESMLIDDQVTPQGTGANRPAGTEGMLVENFIQPREEIQRDPNNKIEYNNAGNRHDGIQHLSYWYCGNRE